MSQTEEIFDIREKLRLKIGNSIVGFGKIVFRQPDAVRIFYKPVGATKIGVGHTVSFIGAGLEGTGQVVAIDGPTLSLTDVNIDEPAAVPMYEMAPPFEKMDEAQVELVTESGSATGTIQEILDSRKGLVGYCVILISKVSHERMETIRLALTEESVKTFERVTEQPPTFRVRLL